MSDIQGNIAHDSVDGASNPIKVGGVASAGRPTAVAVGDRVNGWFTLAGAQVTAQPGFSGTDNLPNNLVAHERTDGTTGYLAVMNHDFNGSTWSPRRMNLAGTLLTNAARTVSTATTDQVNLSGRQLLIQLTMADISTSTGVNLYVQAKDSITGAYASLNAPAATPVNANGVWLYALGPGVSATGASTQVKWAVPMPLPSSFRVYVIHLDVISITYSVTFAIS